MTPYTLVRLIESLFNFYNILIVVYCLLSWFPQASGGLVADLRSVLDTIVGGFLGIFRRYVPPMMGIDFSPVLAILALQIIERFAVRLIANIII